MNDEILLVSEFDSTLAGTFCKNNSIAVVDDLDFMPFSNDTLFVAFTGTRKYYSNGTLYFSDSSFSKTGIAIGLLYGIAYHWIYLENRNYSGIDESEQNKIKEVRAQQYVQDVIEKIGGNKYKALLKKERQRLMTTYFTDLNFVALSSNEVNSINNSMDSIFGRSLSSLETDERLRNLHMGAAFKCCDMAGKDSELAWRCKIEVMDDIMMCGKISF